MIFRRTIVNTDMAQKTPVGDIVYFTVPTCDYQRPCPSIQIDNLPVRLEVWNQNKEPNGQKNTELVNHSTGHSSGESKSKVSFLSNEIGEEILCSISLQSKLFRMFSIQSSIIA